MKVDLSATPNTQIISKWMKYQNLRQKFIKILEANSGDNLYPRLQRVLRRHLSKGRGNKGKNKLLGLYQDKICTTMQQVTKWKATYGIGQDISLTKAAPNKTINPVMKWGEYMNRHPPKKTDKWPTGRWEKWSTWLVIREIQMKTTLRSYNSEWIK